MWKRTKMYRIMSSHTSVLIYQLDANSLLTPPSFSNLWMEKLSDFCTFVSKAFILFTQAITVSGKCESELLPTFLSPHTKLQHKAGTVSLGKLLKWSDTPQTFKNKSMRAFHTIHSFVIWFTDKHFYGCIMNEALMMLCYCCMSINCT